MRSNPTPMHCSIGQGRMHSSLPGVALQNRLTASSSRCKYTFGYLLLIQGAVPQHQCSAALVRAECIRHCPGLPCKLAGSCHYKYTFGYLLNIQLNSAPTSLHCSTGQRKMHYRIQAQALSGHPLSAGACLETAFPATAVERRCQGFLIVPVLVVA